MSPRSALPIDADAPIRSGSAAHGLTDVARLGGRVVFVVVALAAVIALAALLSVRAPALAVVGVAVLSVVVALAASALTRASTASLLAPLAAALEMVEAATSTSRAAALATTREDDRRRRAVPRELHMLAIELGLLVETLERAASRAGGAADARLEAERYETDFLSRLSHDLRTPLNALLGFADVLLHEMDGPLTPVQREDLEIIRGAGARVRRLFDDLFDIAAAAAHRLELELGDVDLERILPAVEHRVRAVLADRDVHCTFAVESPLPHLWADGERVRQALEGLTAGVARTIYSGSLDVRARPADGGVEVEVAFVGAALSPDDLRGLSMALEGWDAHPARRRATWIALALSRRLIELHGGHLDLVTARAGGEARVTAWIPERARTPTALAAPASPRRVAPAPVGRELGQAT
ncbi:MAG: HAMP domain-containing histidine kinase, partial [Myxococcales bacterium]|nr:HAMP domain-containing histidine kinase [Myxococcales bacterium]